MEVLFGIFPPNPSCFVQTRGYFLFFGRYSALNASRMMAFTYGVVTLEVFLRSRSG